MLQHLPNMLTFSRIGILPFFVGLFYVDATWVPWTQFGLFLFACITDYLDGYVARTYRITSRFGQIFDPIADKILVAITLLMLAGNNTIQDLELIPASIILVREIMISGLRELFTSAGVPALPLFWARFKTVMQMTSLSLLVLSMIGHDPAVTCHVLGVFFLWFSALFTVLTGYRYWKLALPYFT